MTALGGGGNWVGGKIEVKKERERTHGHDCSLVIVGWGVWGGDKKI